MENEKLKVWLDFGKFFLGTFLIGFVSMVVKLGFEHRELAIKESDQVGQYVEIALREDVGVRKRFAEYFKTVSLTESYRTRWASYFDVVNAEFEHIQNEVNVFQKQIDSLTRKLEAIKKNSESLQSVDSIYREYENKIERLQNEKEGLEDELEVEDWDFSDERAHRIRIHSLGPDPFAKKALIEYFSNKGFTIEEDDEFEQRQSWMALQPTVFFFSKYAKIDAEHLAVRLSELTGNTFQAKRGKELGIPDDEERTTFFVHYIN